MGVRRQAAIREIDAPAIEELAAGRNGDEDRRVAVLGDADGRGSLHSSCRHVVLVIHVILQGRSSGVVPFVQCAAGGATHGTGMKNARPAAVPGRLGLTTLALLVAAGQAITVSAAGGKQMSNTLEVRHITVSINRPPEEVYRFTAKPENMPRWATGLAGSMEKVGGEWIAKGGPAGGRVEVRFAPPNELGVLDHDVVLESGQTVHNPVRVVPNGAGSEVTFVLFRQPGVSDEAFARDARTVSKDLGLLKSLLEK
jgi:uncharacterized protein YndB with AHSA1/START domain